MIVKTFDFDWNGIEFVDELGYIVYIVQTLYLSGTRLTPFFIFFAMDVL